jgi:type III secretion system FlhB-like substrate exporter
MATNKKITDLTELAEVDLAADDVLAIVDISAGTTHKVRKDTLASALSGVSSIAATSPIAVNQSTGAVTVSTGTIPVASGGTGATSLTDGGVLLGNGTGAVVAMAVLADGAMIVGDGTTDPVPEAGATLRTSIGVGTGDSPQFTAVNVGAAADTTVARASAGDINVEGNLIYRAGGTDVPVADGGTGASSASAAATALGVGTGDSPQFTAVNVGAAADTTVARASAGDINVEGNLIYRAGGTDVPVADGGTGASTFTDGGVLLGNGTGAIVAMAVLSDSQMIVGDGTTDPVAESGATLRTSIGVGTTDAVQFKTVLATTDTDTSNTGTVTLDFAANQNFVLTFTGNVILGNPSTESVGQAGVIVCIQDGTGSRTLGLEAQFKTAGDAGITLSTAANAVDIVPYFVSAADSILIGAVQLALSGA